MVTGGAEMRGWGAAVWRGLTVCGPSSDIDDFGTNAAEGNAVVANLVYEVLFGG
jgi:hypothetical protein